MQMSTAVLGSVEEVTPDWLTDVLRRQEALAGIRVTKVRVDEAKQSFMASIAKLRIGYDGDPPVGSPTRLFLKTSRPPDQPASSASGRGEIAFYRTGAPAMADPPVPRCYDAAFEDATQRFHLLLEDLSESHRELSDYPLPRRSSRARASSRPSPGSMPRCGAIRGSATASAPGFPTRIST